MKRLYNLYFLIVCILFVGCEKSIAPESDSGSGISLVGISDNAKQTALTIAEAQQQPTSTMICVKGFIVASTTKSMSNATYSSPFAGSTAIVLASRQSNGTSNQFDKEELFPICLTDASKGIKETYNLESNPQYYNQYVFISGTRDTYLTLSGLKKVKAIEVDPNHVVTQDEQPDAVKEGESIDDSEEEGTEGNDDIDGDNEEGEGEGEGEGIGEGTGKENTVMTVAGAKTADNRTILTVKGYIVGAIKGGGLNVNNRSVCFEKGEKPFFRGIRSGILLADTPYTGSNEYDLENLTDLLPISLDNCKNETDKEKYNLSDNPDRQNKLVTIKGRKCLYIVLDALGEDIEFISSPTP